MRGNRLLVSTATANKLIADVWFARADFAQDNPGIIEGLVRGIFDAMAELKQDSAKQKVSELMATGYGIPAADALGMLGDAHSTNWGENYQFFVNQNNPTNFARVWIATIDSCSFVRSGQANISRTPARRQICPPTMT